MTTGSPFPGMDPYAEARHWWKGLHTQLIGKLSTDLLPPLLAPAYYVDAERSLQVITGSDIVPEVEVVQTASAPGVHPAGAGLPVAEATLVVTEQPSVEEEEAQESAIFVREAETERLVTVIEILSYSNKTPGEEKRAQYMSKRRGLLRAGVHLVEIDLLRWGQRVVSGLPAQAYHVLVSRADDRPNTRVWSFGLEKVIPDVPLPLISHDEYVPLPLQAAFDAVYRARNFRERLDYARDPEGPLSGEQRAIMKAKLAEEGIGTE